MLRPRHSGSSCAFRFFGRKPLVLGSHSAAASGSHFASSSAAAGGSSGCGMPVRGDFFLLPALLAALLTRSSSLSRASRARSAARCKIAVSPLGSSSSSIASSTSVSSPSSPAIIPTCNPAQRTWARRSGAQTGWRAAAFARKDIRLYSTQSYSQSPSHAFIATPPCTAHTSGAHCHSAAHSAVVWLPRPVHLVYHTLVYHTLVYRTPVYRTHQRRSLPQHCSQSGRVPRQNQPPSRPDPPARLTAASHPYARYPCCAYSCERATYRPRTPFHRPGLSPPPPQ